MFAKFFIVALIALLPLLAVCQEVGVAQGNPSNAVEDPLKVLKDIVISGNTVGGSINVNGGSDQSGGSDGGFGGDEEGGSDDEATGSMKFRKNRAKKNNARKNLRKNNARKH